MTRLEAPVAARGTAGDDAPAHPVGRARVYAGIAGLVVVAFIATYSFAVGGTPGAGASTVSASAVASPAGGGGGAACACCGGDTGPAVSGQARVDAGVQRINVDTSTGSWSPGEITLKAGVPTEITFAEGQGCLAQVVFSDLGVSADLRDGGAVVRLPALTAGEHAFTCGMGMVSGTLIVR